MRHYIADEIFFADKKTGEIITSSVATTSTISCEKVRQEASAILSGVSLTETAIVSDKDSLEKIIPQSTMMIEKRNFPRGNKLPKRKRIRDKWAKKYIKTIEIETSAMEVRDGEIKITGFMK